MKRIALCLTILASVSCTNKESKVETPKTVTVDMATLDPVVEENNYPGTIVALKEVELRADVTGYVMEIPVKDGQLVKKGQVLYRIDQTRYKASLNQADSRLRIAQANQERLQRDVNRYERLKEGNAVATQVYDDALTALTNAKQEVISALAEVENARVNLDYATVRAPFDGTIGFSSVRLGALVSPGQTPLNIISSNDPIGLDFFAEERAVSFFLKMQKDSETVLRDNVFLLTLGGGESYPHAGTIENIDRAVDPGTGTIRIRLSFPNPEGSLKPGMSARLSIRRPATEAKITVPQKAVLERLGEKYVFTATDGNAQQKRVTTGIRTKDRIVIEEGLTEGQQVIVSGIQRLADGDSIQIKTEQSL